MDDIKNDNKSTSLEDSKKIDLYINNKDNIENEEGINIMHIFSNMKERFNIYLYIMIIGLLLGFLVPYVLTLVNNNQSKAISVIEYSYEGAEELKAPDGSELDVTEIKSSYVIQKALDKTGLDDKLSVSMVQSNISITGILTEETQQQLEIMNTILEDDPTKASQYSDVELKYRNQYIVTLGNVFYNEKKKIKLTSSETSELLEAITSNYADYFVDTYLDNKLPENKLSSLNTEAMDYLDILENVSDILDDLKEYCDEKAKIVEGYRSLDGMSFSDLSNVINNLSKSNISLYESYVYLNGISKDSENQLISYKYQKKEATLNLEEVNSNITAIKASIENFKDDTVIIPSSDSNQSQKTVTITSEYYNELVNELTLLNEEKSSLEETISKLDNKISQLETNVSDEKKSKASEYTNKSISDTEEIYSLVKNMTKELIESSSYKSAYLSIIQTSSTTKTSYKKVLIGTVIGLALGFVAWCVDGLILEIKDTNKRKENE